MHMAWPSCATCESAAAGPRTGILAWTASPWSSEADGLTAVTGSFRPGLLSKPGLKLPVTAVNPSASDDQGDAVQANMPVRGPAAADSQVAHDGQAMCICQR